MLKPLILITTLLCSSLLASGQTDDPVGIYSTAPGFEEENIETTTNNNQEESMDQSTHEPEISLEISIVTPTEKSLPTSTDIDKLKHGNTENPTKTTTEKTSLNSTKKPTRVSTVSHISKSTDRTTEKTTKMTTEKPVKKTTVASMHNTPHHHSHKTTENPIRKRPHCLKHRINCAENEKYEQRPNTVLQPQTCEQLGVQCDDCDEEDDESDDSSKGACICVEGYVRSQRGVCIPAEKCPSCGGDKNATLGCGINCGRRCSDYEKEVQCLQVCYVNRCDCRDNFVLDEFTGKCVLPKDCSRKNASNSKKPCADCEQHKSCTDSNEEDSGAKSNSDEDDNEGNSNEDSDHHNNNSVSTTTRKPTSSSKCFEEAFALYKRANFAFGGKVLKELIRLKPTENVMISSPVVLYLLAQVGISAKGDAYTQIMAALNFNNVELAKCFFRHIIPILMNIQDVEYDLIGKMYSDSVCPLTRNFRRQTENTFTFKPENLDFQNPKSARVISEEVAKQTNNRIVDFIKPAFLSISSSLLLISAEYFKGRWQKQFDHRHTKEMDFYVNNFKTIKVRTMYLQGTFLYAESAQLDAKLLKMKYVGKDFSCVIVLPNWTEGLMELVDKVRNPDIMTSALNSLKMETVEIFMPSFNITVANRLKVPIERANVTDIFHNSTAGLEDITSCSRTRVYNVLQKATFQIDEYGAGHSKMTDFEMKDPSPKTNNRRSCTFRVDHPYLFILFYRDVLVYIGVRFH